jgi:ribosomal protein L40E
MAQAQSPGLKVDDPDGDGAFYVLPYNEDLAQQSALLGLNARTDPEPDSTTEDPVSGKEEEGGVIARANGYMTSLGPVALEAVGLHGMEISKANAKRAGELYRNKFPLLSPRFVRQCEECGAEFDEEADVCEFCGSTDLREPSPKQRTRADQFFKSVNREGQSLRQLYKFLARDGGRLGTWLHIVKKSYTYWDKPTIEIGGETVIERGEVYEQPLELVRGDPKRIKPVVDENGRIGNWWWACPVCEDRTDRMAREPGVCEEHGVDRREVHYAEVEQVGDDKPVKVFFEDEVIDYAPFEPRLAGKDGLSPLDTLWLKQAILHWMDLYAGGYYDQQNTNRYPGRMVILHTSNKQAVEKQLAQAKDEQDEDPYSQGFLYNEVPPGADSSSDTAQVLDLMSDEILGQSDQLKQDFKSDIRSRYGLVDAQDSELKDAGGLNNEGLQLTINDRDKATIHQDLMEGPLRKLMDSLGFDDWAISFVPPEGPEEEPPVIETVRATALAEQNGLAYSIEDGRFELQDTDGVIDPEPAPEAGDGAGDNGDGPGEDAPLDIDETIPNPEQNINAGTPVNEAIRHLEGMQRDLVWGGADAVGLEQQARQESWLDSGDMPQFVKELIQQALDNAAIYRGEYEAPNVTGGAVKNFFQKKLDQPQGWSRRSLIQDFAERFELTEEQARSTLETQLTNVLNEAREVGYRQQGDTDDRLFKWVGPADDDKTDACWELLRETNPRFGGTPRPLDELKELVAQKREEHYPEFGGAEWSVHWNERDTYVEHYDRPN